MWTLNLTYANTYENCIEYVKSTYGTNVIVVFTTSEEKEKIKTLNVYAKMQGEIKFEPHMIVEIKREKLFSNIKK